jgi:hypothetical protein
MLLQYLLYVLVCQLLPSLSKRFFQIIRRNVIRVIYVEMFKQLYKLLLCQHLFDRQSGSDKLSVIELIIAFIVYVLEHLFYLHIRYIGLLLLHSLFQLLSIDHSSLVFVYLFKLSFKVEDLLFFQSLHQDVHGFFFEV